MGCSSVSGECSAVLVGRYADSSNEVAAHRFCGAEAAPRRDRHHGVVGLLELATSRLGADSFDVSPGRLADFVGEHPGEVSWALRGGAGHVGDGWRAAGG